MLILKATPSTVTPVGKVADPSAKSVFWPLQFLVVCLGIGMGFHLFELNQDRLTMERDIRALTPRGSEAIAAKNKLFSLLTEINQLAKQDATAAQLLAEFKIQLRSNAATPLSGR